MLLLLSLSVYCCSGFFLHSVNPYRSLNSRNNQFRHSSRQQNVVTSVLHTTEILPHSPLITSFISQFKAIFTGQYVIERHLFQKVQKLMSLTDLIVTVALIYSYKPILRIIYEIVHLFVKEKPTYRSSLIGHLEETVKFVVFFPPFLYTVDLFTILINYLGVNFKTKGNLPHLAATIAVFGIIGSFATRTKDWIFLRVRKTLSNSSRDYAKERITDELVSVAIWIVIAAFCLEISSKELGIGIGSMFALGGIGSASFVLAMRSSMENLIGGLLLKFQDKFRVGEKISLPAGNGDGVVEEISYLSTKIRKDDDSYITVPNAKFTQGEVINWSRTPFRLFKTNIVVKESNIKLLPQIIEAIRHSLCDDPAVEAKQRDLIVSATGFNAGSVVIEIQARLKGNSDQEVATVRTRVVDKIASTVENIYSLDGKPPTL